MGEIEVLLVRISNVGESFWFSEKADKIREDMSSVRHVRDMSGNVQ